MGAVHTPTKAVTPRSRTQRSQTTFPLTTVDLAGNTTDERHYARPLEVWLMARLLLNDGGDR
jgi:hypothetical protein